MKIKKLQLTKLQNKKQFDCGHDSLNAFFRVQARQADARQIVRTMVIVDSDDHSRTLAYYSTSPCEITAPEGLRIYNNYPHKVPFLKLARLATDLNFRGLGLGEVALLSAISDAAKVHFRTAIGGLVVDAKDEGVAAFYRKYDFIEVEPGSLTLFLPIRDCIAISEETGDIEWVDGEPESKGSGNA